MKRFSLFIGFAPCPPGHVGALYKIMETESAFGEWVKASDVFRSCTCETKYGTTGGCVICNPGKALELADRAQAVCEAQHGAGDRCCLMREVADALRALAANAFGDDSEALRRHPLKPEHAVWVMETAPSGTDDWRPWNASVSLTEEGSKRWENHLNSGRYPELRFRAVEYRRIEH